MQYGFVLMNWSSNTLSVTATDYFRKDKNEIYIYTTGWAGIAQSVQRLATGWMVRGSNPGGGEIFSTRPDRSWGPPSLLYNGYRGKAAGAWS
jgi:hypothetical protein